MSEVKIAVTIEPESEISQTFLNDLIKYQTSIDIIELRVDQWATPRVDDIANVIDKLYKL
ncbi:3-dehydroquinate dehydratase, partial [Staphylococcus cohnii]